MRDIITILVTPLKLSAKSNNVSEAIAGKISEYSDETSCLCDNLPSRGEMHNGCGKIAKYRRVVTHAVSCTRKHAGEEGGGATQAGKRCLYQAPLARRGQTRRDEEAGAPDARGTFLTCRGACESARRCELPKRRKGEGKREREPRTATRARSARLTHALRSDRYL